VFPGSALDHLRTVGRTLGPWTVPTEVGIPVSHSTLTDARVADPDTADRRSRLGRELALYAGETEYPGVLSDGAADR
jgi:hypothetical protein